jgi:murein DD-endopeptidase MepM/ murein hydrolase activator NlpD
MNIINKLRVSLHIHIIRLVFIVTIASPIIAYAAHTGLRPITNGKVNQCYLYGEVCPPDATYPHRGIDFPAAMGTEVKAIANGRVVALRGDVNNNSGVNFGNYVLIRHEQQHWVRQNNGQAVGQWGYVYSLYAHLKQNSVIPALDAWVNAGTKIAEVDNTGNSGGNHLHLQIIVHQSDTPQMSGADPSLGWTEPNSRNAELWLAAFNNGSTQTGTAVGLVTDINGNPVGGLKITGIQKPASATSGTYGYCIICAKISD